MMCVLLAHHHPVPAVAPALLGKHFQKPGEKQLTRRYPISMWCEFHHITKTNQIISSYIILLLCYCYWQFATGSQSSWKLLLLVVPMLCCTQILCHMSNLVESRNLQITCNHIPREGHWPVIRVTEWLVTSQTWSLVIGERRQTLLATLACLSVSLYLPWTAEGRNQTLVRRVQVWAQLVCKDPPLLP